MLIVICCLPADQTRAENRPGGSSGSLKYTIDTCQFRGAEGETRFEIYYSLDLGQLFDKQNNIAVLEMITELSDYGDKTVFLKKARRAIPLEADNRGSRFVDMLEASLSPQNLSLEVEIADSVSGLKGHVSMQVDIREFSSSLSMSDLMLSSQLQKAGANDIFDKGGISVIPRAERIFSASVGDTKLYVFYEVSNLSIDSGTAHYMVRYKINSSNGQQVYSNEIPALETQRPGSTRLEVIPLQSLPTGHYRLQVQVTDLGTNETLLQERLFSYDSGNKQEETYLPMAKEDIERYYDQIKYVATEEEKQRFKKSSPGDKLEFLLNFWKMRDPDPGTEENEFMTEHFNRLAYCEQEISGGIDSDMGRIYIAYGQPLEIEREFSRLDFTKPVEIWTYAIEGRIEFVFVDRARDGEYTLVHSTQKDEIFNPDWKEMAR